MTQKEFQELKSGLDLLGDRLETLRTRSDAGAEAYDLRTLRRIAHSIADAAKRFEGEARREVKAV